MSFVFSLFFQLCGETPSGGNHFFFVFSSAACVLRNALPGVGSQEAVLNEFVIGSWPLWPERAPWSPIQPRLMLDSTPGHPRQMVIQGQAAARLLRRSTPLPGSSDSQMRPFSTSLKLLPGGSRSTLWGFRKKRRNKTKQPCFLFHKAAFQIFKDSEYISPLFSSFQDGDVGEALFKCGVSVRLDFDPSFFGGPLCSCHSAGCRIPLVSSEALPGYLSLALLSLTSSPLFPGCRWGSILPRMFCLEVVGKGYQFLFSYSQTLGQGCFYVWLYLSDEANKMNQEIK